MLVGRLRTLSPTSSPRPHRVVFGPGQWQRTKPQAGLNVCVCALLLLVVAVVGREGGPGEPGNPIHNGYTVTATKILERCERLVRVSLPWAQRDHGGWIKVTITTHNTHTRYH